MNIKGLIARVQQIRYRNGTSFPYISGDNFASLADFQFTADSNLRTGLDRIVDSRLFFCEANSLNYFLENLSELKMGSILIVGNGDHEYFDFELIPKKFSTVLLQNSFISDNQRIFTLPIGIENLRIGVNGIPGRFKFEYPKRVDRRTLLIGPFGNTSSERLLLDELKNLPNIDVDLRTERVPPRKYPKLLREATWVACPRGNGIDTHRVWESLYSGSKPIVLDNEWSRSLVDFGYPLLLTKDWTAKSVVEVISNDPIDIFDPRQYPPLWIDYWKSWLESRLTNS